MGLKARLGFESGVLSERRFRNLFFATSASVFGDNLIAVALTFAVLDLTGSATALGGVWAGRTVAQVIFYLVGGVWADRVPRQVLMMFSDVGRAITQGVLALLLLTHSAELWHVVVLMVINGIASAFFQPASTGLTPKTVSPAHLQEANAYLSFADSLSSIAGPAIAGVIVATVGSGWAIAADSATFVVSAFFLLRIDLPPSAQKIEKIGFWSDLLSGWREVSSRSWVWVSILNFMLFQLLILPTFFVLGPVMADRFYRGATSWAAVLALSGIGALLGDLLSLRLKPAHPLRVSFLVALATVPVMVLLGTRFPIPIVAMAAVPWGMAFTYGNTLWFTALQRHIPDEAISRVSSYDWLGSSVLSPIGFVLIGPIAAAVGIRATMIGAALIMGVLEILTAFVPSIWNLPAHPTADPTKEPTQETAKQNGRATCSGPLRSRRCSGSRLRPGDPTALSKGRLRLLPSGPDRVHGSESRRTRPSTLLSGGCPVTQRPQASTQPGIKRVSGTGDP